MYAHTQDNKIHTYEIIHLQRIQIQNNTNTISGYYAAQDNTEHSGYSGHRPDTEQPQHRYTDTEQRTTATQVHYIRFAQI